MAHASVFVEYSSDEDLATELARLASVHASKDTGEKFFEDAQVLISSGKQGELLAKIFAETNSIIDKLPEKDAEPGFLVAFSLLKKLPVDAQPPVLSGFISAVTSVVNEKAQFRLKLLNNAYNVITSRASRFELFKSILQYALDSHSESAVASVHTDLDRLSKSWNVSAAQLREVYKLVRDVFRNRNQAQETHDWTLKYLEFFKDESDPAIGGTEDEAVRCIVEAINLPGLYSFDSLAGLLPIKRLAQSKPGAWKLLETFVSGTLEDYRGLPAAELDSFKAAGLSADFSENKIRCLTLASLGSQSASVPYSAVAKALQIDENEVESYVVTAIADGVVDARLDQLRRQVNVSRTIQRNFGHEDWAQLSETLQAWKTNVRAILQSIDVVKEQQPGPQH